MRAAVKSCTLPPTSATRPETSPNPSEAAPRLLVRADAEAAAVAAAAIVANRLADARASGTGFHAALAGGRTPGRAYAILASQVADWSGVNLWLTDERRVPRDDDRSNARMVAETLIAAVVAPAPPVLHPVPTELPLNAASDAYGSLIESLVAASDGGTPVLDLAILGLGEDGHTASLFPDDPALLATTSCVAVRAAPKPPPERISLSLTLLNAARERLVLVTGETKTAALAGMLGPPTGSVPASLLERSRTTVVCDAAAVGVGG